MSFQQWLGTSPISQFVQEHYGRLPHSGRTDGELCSLGSWSVLDKILGDDDPDVMVVRRGQQRSGTAPTSAEQAERLIEDGFTVLVRNAQRHHEGLSKMAGGFREEFAAPVNVHVYVTPGGEFGFGWHYDVEEVFILQTSGTKEYSLRKNTVHPWPLVETMPDNLQHEREIMPLMKCSLAAGDWLYIPAGYWHKANVLSEEVAISLAVGVMARPALDVLDSLRRKLAASLLWRQRLPTTGSASPLSDEELRAALRAVLNELTGDLQRELRDESFLNALVGHLRDSHSPG